MEITAGKLKGMPLASPDVHAPVRPTSVRARQAFFDSLGDLSGKTFADLCAGSDQPWCCQRDFCGKGSSLIAHDPEKYSACGTGIG